MEKRKKAKGNKFSWKLFSMFIGYQFLFICITAPFLVYYGPFERVKKSMVDRAMSTMSHQYIATFFLSQDKIDKIRNVDGGNSTPTNEIEKVDQIKIAFGKDNTIERYDIHEKRFDGYILEIKNPKRIKVGVTQKRGKRGQTTSEMAEANGAIAAINGGGFTDNTASGKEWVGTGANPIGIVISDEKTICSTVKEKDKVSVTAFTKEGKLIVGSHSIEELKKLGVKEALSFDNTLIVNGKAQIKNDGGKGIDPRTAIGQKKDGTVVFLVIDGRAGFKQGATLREVQNLLLNRQVVNASELDGGSSSTMYYDGEVINNPCDKEGERTVATVLYVK